MLHGFMSMYAIYRLIKTGFSFFPDGFQFRFFSRTARA
jgi:hypothetical protein